MCAEYQSESLQCRNLLSSTWKNVRPCGLITLSRRSFNKKRKFVVWGSSKHNQYSIITVIQCVLNYISILLQLSEYNWCLFFSVQTTATHVEHRPLTIPESPMLHTKERAFMRPEPAKPEPPSTQFVARPMPIFHSPVRPVRGTFDLSLLHKSRDHSQIMPVSKNTAITQRHFPDFLYIHTMLT